MPGATIFRHLFITTVLLLAATASHATKVVWVETLELVDVEPAVSTTLKAKLTSELESMGAALVMASASTPCLDAACRSTAIRAAKAAAGLAVTVVRGGPVVQISAVAFAPDGSESARDERVVDYDALSTDAELIGGDVRATLLAALRGDVATPPQETPPDDTEPDATTNPTEGTQETPASEVETPAVTTSSGPGLLDWVGYGLVGVGAVSLVVGLGAAGAAYAHYNTPGGDGALKALDPTVLDVGLGAAAVGAVVAGAGAGVIAYSLLTSE